MKIVLPMVFVTLLLGACASQPPGGSAYVPAMIGVRPGESVYDVARRLNVPPGMLIEANHLSAPYHVVPGETLTVPVPPTYLVRRGDTLSGVARRFNLDDGAIARLNQLSPPYTLHQGQQLQMPNMAVGATAPAPAPPPPPEPPVVERSVESTPLAPPPGVKQSTGPIDRSSPTALAPAPEPTPPPRDTAADASGAPALVWPVRGEIVSAFGSKPGGLHNDGINIAAAEGTPVKAAAAGTVSFAGTLKGFGNLVLIAHGGEWVTAYAHMAEVEVKKGDAVKAGQQIGTVGQTGTIDSPQLHFELRHVTEAVDPTGRLGS